VAQVRLTEQAQNELDAIIAYYERVGAADYAEVLEENLIARL
jgi:plasmid stabilization system protein ParE